MSASKERHGTASLTSPPKDDIHNHPCHGKFVISATNNILPGRDSNPGPPRYKSGANLIAPRKLLSTRKCTG